MKKKVAIILSNFEGGGAERVVSNIIRYLDQDKIELKIILLEKKGVYLKSIPENIEIIDLNCKRARYSIKKLIKAINSFEPEVIFSAMGQLNLIISAMRMFYKGNPSIIVREDNTPSKKLADMKKVKGGLFKVLYKILYPCVDLIIAQCESMRKDMIDNIGINGEKIKVIYNPVDILKISREKDLYNPYNNNNINLVAVGRLVYQKGFDILIDAFKRVNDKIPNVRLTILGDGKLLEDLNKKIDKYNLSDSVTIESFKENPYPYINYADTFILSSIWEGFPNVLLEALACDTKVVATDCKSGPREILGDNTWGLLVKENDSEELAKGIIRSINTKKNENTRALDYDVQKIVKIYQEIFLTIN